MTLLAPMVVARKGYYTDLAKWRRKQGFANLRVDGEYQPTDDWPRLARHHEHDIDLPVGTLKVNAGMETNSTRSSRRRSSTGRAR